MNSHKQKILINGTISYFFLMFALVPVLTAMTAFPAAASSEPYVSDPGTERQTDVQDVEVKVNPDRNANCVKAMEKGSMTIAVLGSDELDVEKIQANSVTVSSVKVAGEVQPYAMECRDIDSDGCEDLVMSFNCNELMTQLGLKKCFCNEVPLKVRATIEENEGAKIIQGSDTTLILPRFR